jgi:hypothetical protein
MNALNQLVDEARMVRIIIADKPLRSLQNNCRRESLNQAEFPPGELYRKLADPAHYTLVGAPYFNGDPSITGAVQYCFVPHVHDPFWPQMPDADLHLALLGDYTDFPSEIGYALEPLYGTDSTGPLALRIEFIRSPLPAFMPGVPEGGLN